MRNFTHPAVSVQQHPAHHPAPALRGSTEPDTFTHRLPTLAALQLPVGEALASPYCRTMDHARLMLPMVTPRNEIREAQGNNHAGLKQLLASPVEAGTNRWIVGHGIAFRAVAGAPHLAEGEAAVIRPETTGWTVVVRLAVADWATLGAAP